MSIYNLFVVIMGSYTVHTVTSFLMTAFSSNVKLLVMAMKTVKIETH